MDLHLPGRKRGKTTAEATVFAGLGDRNLLRERSGVLLACTLKLKEDERKQVFDATGWRADVSPDEKGLIISGIERRGSFQKAIGIRVVGSFIVFSGHIMLRDEMAQEPTYAVRMDAFPLSGVHGLSGYVMDKVGLGPALAEVAQAQLDMMAEPVPDDPTLYAMSPKNQEWGLSYVQRAIGLVDTVHATAEEQLNVPVYPGAADAASAAPPRLRIVN